MHVPGPFRAAVGLVATAASEAKRLPDRAIELPMLAVSTALQASLRAQQRYARLTARGDEVLSRRATTDEPPEWATFDEPVSVEQLRRTAMETVNGGAGPDTDRLLQELFGVGDPTDDASAAGDDEFAADDGPDATVTQLRGTERGGAAGTARQARKPSPRKAAEEAAAPKSASKKSETGKAPKSAKKSATTKSAAEKPTKKRSAESRSAAKKTAAERVAEQQAAAEDVPAKNVSKPRHTSPSAFDNAGDD